jgi:hypothetical protein
LESDDPGVGSKQDRLESNVVRFPRDWLGPLEELVPIGPSSGQESDLPRDREPDGQTAPAERVVDFPPSAPLRADAFWGEDSASIHDALEPPAQPADAASASAEATRGHDWRRRRRISMRFAREIDPARIGRAMPRAWAAAAQHRVPAIPRRLGHRAQAVDTVRPRIVGRGKPTRSFGALSAVALAVLGGAFAFLSLHGASSRHLASRAGGGGLAEKAFASLPSDISAVGSLGRRHLPIAQSGTSHRQSHPPGRASGTGGSTYVRASTARSAPQPAAPSPSPAPVYAGAQQVGSPPAETSGPTGTQAQQSAGSGSAHGANSSPSSTPTTSSNRHPFGLGAPLGPGHSPAS